MSLSLFNSAAIEVLTDVIGKPYFKRADLGRYLGISRIKDMFKDVKNTARRDVNQGAALSSPLRKAIVLLAAVSSKPEGLLDRISL